MTDANEMRRRRDRMKRDTAARLKQQLRLQGELLCDSHKDFHNEILGRMMKAIGAILNLRLSEDKKASLAAVFDQCKWREEQVTEISWSGNMIHLCGEFDLRELAKRIVWIEVAEHEKVVGEDE